MNELALFAGAGGGILGGHLLGWRTVCAVEIDPYARSVLLARQNDGALAPFPIWDDIRTFDATPWRGIVDVVSGGFPCQDISAAGGGAGIDGERSGLWGEMARIIGEVRPRYVFVENSPLLVGRGLARVLGDLAEMGFDARWGVIGACDIGAPHKRDRIWIVANAWRRKSQQRCQFDMQWGRAGEAEQAGLGCRGKYVADADSDGVEERLRQDGKQIAGEGRESGPEALGGREVVADADRNPWHQGRACDTAQEPGGWNADRGCERPTGMAHHDSQRRQEQHASSLAGEPRQHPRSSAESGQSGWWAAEPDVGRVADELADRLDFTGAFELA